MISHQRKETVEVYVSNVVSLLFANREDLSGQYFMSAWQRICNTFDNFVQDLSAYYPILLQTSQEIKNSE